jgi:hypothetical protein
MSGLAGGVIAAMVFTMIPVGARTGDPVIAGAANQAGRQTNLRSNAARTLTLINTRDDGTALELRVEPGSPPLRTNSSAKVHNLNADQVDGLSAAALTVPSGAVMFFDAPGCPSGWQEYTLARGRTVVGLTRDGTLRGLVAPRLGDREQLVTSDVGDHNHVWSRYARDAKNWYTYNSGGGIEELVDWVDGTDNLGGGEFPLQPHSSEDSGSGVNYYFTTREGSHHHVATMPYVQLLACRKN